MYGENHAKQIVLKEAKELTKELKNGNANNPATQGKAIALLLDMISPMYMAELVTIDQCKNNQSECKHTQENQEKKKALKLKLGPFAIEGNFSSITILSLILVVCSGGLIFVIGKAAQLW